MKKCILFKGVSEEEILNQLAHIKYEEKAFKKNELIANEGDECLKVGILINGSVQIQKFYSSGNNVILQKFSSGNIFGEVIIFSDKNTYPASIVASEASDILFINREEVLKLCTLSSMTLNNFMSLLSNRILDLNKKLKIVSSQSIREKINLYLLELYKSQGTTKIKLNTSKREIAEYLGIQRPSFSRELINMREEGIIEFGKDFIQILDINEIIK